MLSAVQKKSLNIKILGNLGGVRDCISKIAYAFFQGQIAEKGNVNVNIFQIGERTFYFAQKRLQMIISLKKRL